MDRVIEAASGIEVYTSRHRHDVGRRVPRARRGEGKHWTASADDHGHVQYVRPPDGTPRRTVERIFAGA